ncbi:MAG: DMT family transporter [Verrucomicrobia bacterium]|nr:DMT family transporter [Verrucomicrobiota bacterium]
MIAAGIFVSLQGPVNLRLRLATESPVFSAAVSFLTGALILLTIAAAGQFGGFGAGFRGLLAAPWWAYFGGALGITFVLGAILSIPIAGTAVVICSGILGQMLGSMLVDSFGWFGVQRITPTPLRVLGVSLVFVGVLLVQKK